MRRYLVFALCLCLLAGGCGKKDGDTRVLEGYDDPSVQEVRDFSAYTEAETEPPTEPPTETEPWTEPPTEPPTETEAFPEEEPYSEDYEFSEYNVLQAVFHAYGGLGAVPYVSTVVQDPQSMTRTQTVSAMDGGITIVLEADSVSGQSYKKVTLDYSVDNGENAVADALLGFDNGITESNIERFMDGAYNGADAPLIGLADASYTLEGGHATVVLVKNDAEPGSVPYWETPSADFSQFVRSPKFHGELRDGCDLFSGMLQGIEFGTVTMDSSAFTSFEKATDEKGNAAGGSATFQASYHTDDGHAYEVTLADAGPEKGMTVTCHRADAATPEAAMALADHLYQQLFEGMLDTKAGLAAGYSTEHCSVTKTGDGFSVRFF